jgi:hypothetical protein
VKKEVDGDRRSRIEDGPRKKPAGSKKKKPASEKEVDGDRRSRIEDGPRKKPAGSKKLVRKKKKRLDKRRKRSKLLESKGRQRRERKRPLWRPVDDPKGCLVR